LTTEEGGSQAIATLRLKVEDRKVSAVAVREQEEGELERLPRRGPTLPDRGRGAGVVLGMVVFMRKPGTTLRRNR
jgi:hypothetical protein